MLWQNKVFIIFIVLFVSCKNTQKNVQQKEPAKTGGTTALASNEATIIAKIISINELRDESGPCAKAPCYAEIQIERISSKGSLFQPGDISTPLPVNFSFTLSPTQGLFPGMKTNYPGLKINDKFEAKIQSRPALGDKLTYTVYGYKKIN